MALGILLSCLDGRKSGHQFFCSEPTINFLSLGQQHKRSSLVINDVANRAEPNIDFEVRTKLLGNNFFPHSGKKPKSVT